MEPYKIEKDVVQSLRTEFVENMKHLPSFVDNALADKLLSSEHKENILSDHKSDSTQIRTMLDYIEKKLPSKSEKFLKALMKSENTALVQKLLPDANISDLKRHFNLEEGLLDARFSTESKYKITKDMFISCRPSFVRFMSDIPSFTDHALEINLFNWEDKNEITSLSNPDNQKRKIFDIMQRNLPEKSDQFLYALNKSGNEYLIDNMVPEYEYPETEEADTSTRELADDFCYPIENKGRVLIIENVTFPDYPELERNGSENDRKRLTEFWERLNYKVIVKRNLSASYMKSVLHEQIFKEEGKNEDCFILFILSHGKVSGIYGTDRETISYSEIFETFNKCPIWNDKPKLIYFNACQDYVQSDDTKGFSEIYPAKHFYIMYATIPGESAWRDTKTGSRLIQSLMDVYNKHYLQQDVETMGKRTNSMVYFGPSAGNKETPTQLAVRFACLPFKLYLTKE